MSETPIPEQLNSRGQSAFKRKDYQTAAQAFLEAAESYLSRDDQASFAEMRNNASVAFLQGGNAQQAWLAAEGTDAIFDRLGDQYRQALALGNQAAALEAAGDTRRAIALYRESAEMLKGPKHHEQRSAVLRSLSALEIRTGDQLRALASMQAALEISPRLSFKEKALKKLLDIPIHMLNR